MTDYPDDWFRDGKPAAGGSAASGNPAGGNPAGPAADPSSDQTMTVAGPHNPAGQYQVRPPGKAPWPDQPPLQSDDNIWARGFGQQRGRQQQEFSPAGYGPPGSGPGGPRPPRRRRRWLRPGRIFGILALVVVVLLVAVAGSYFYLNSKLTRQNILVSYAGRPATGAGTNWLIAGSDSRQGLTKKEEREFSTGGLDGAGRSDTIMILHLPPGGGRPLLISIPRDSYVDIPGYGMNKINAAFSIGGPALLAKTIQSDTGLYINHFMDIGFGGFVHVVNAVGGVRLCLKEALYDKASGIHLKKGCHVLSGGEALAYVRDRHSFATQDLQREQDQRIFLKALLTKVTSPSVMFNPFRSWPAASGVVSTLTVDQGTSLYQLVEVALAMRNPQTTTVPIASANYATADGDAVLWDQSQARELFSDLQSGATVPGSLITGSRQAS